MKKCQDYIASFSKLKTLSIVSIHQRRIKDSKGNYDGGIEQDIIRVKINFTTKDANSEGEKVIQWGGEHSYKTEQDSIMDSDEDIVGTIASKEQSYRDQSNLFEYVPGVSANNSLPDKAILNRVTTLAASKEKEKKKDEKDSRISGLSAMSRNESFNYASQFDDIVDEQLPSP